MLWCDFIAVQCFGPSTASALLPPALSLSNPRHQTLHLRWAQVWWWNMHPDGIPMWQQTRLQRHEWWDQLWWVAWASGNMLGCGMEYQLGASSLTLADSHFARLLSLIRNLFQTQKCSRLRSSPPLAPQPPPSRRPRCPPAHLDPAERIRPRVRADSASHETTSATERGTARMGVTRSDVVSDRRVYFFN